MSDDTAWYSPNRKPPARKAETVPGEVLWTTMVDGVEWSLVSFSFMANRTVGTGSVEPQVA